MSPPRDPFGGVHRKKIIGHNKFPSRSSSYAKEITNHCHTISAEYIHIGNGSQIRAKGGRTSLVGSTEEKSNRSAARCESRKSGALSVASTVGAPPLTESNRRSFPALPSISRTSSPSGRSVYVALSFINARQTLP